MSWVEALTNVVVGFVVAVITQLVVFPVAGLRITFETNLATSGIFTIVSIGRSYLPRRLFEALRVRAFQR